MCECTFILQLVFPLAAVRINEGSLCNDTQQQHTQLPARGAEVQQLAALELARCHDQ